MEHLSFAGRVTWRRLDILVLKDVSSEGKHTAPSHSDCNYKHSCGSYSCSPWLVAVDFGDERYVVLDGCKERTLVGQKLLLRGQR